MPTPALRRTGVIIATTVAVLVGLITPTAAFDDVPDGTYATDAIDWMADQGITQGTAEGVFSPGKTMSRAEFLTFLWRLAGSPDAGASTSRFSDAPQVGAFAGAVAWASMSGVANGRSDSRLDPLARVSRGEAVTFMWRYMCSPAVDRSHDFGDVSDTSIHAPAVAWAHGAGVMNGRDGSSFDPSASMTRAEGATVIWRLAGNPATGSPGDNRSSRAPDCGGGEVTDVPVPVDDPNQDPIAVADSFTTDEDTAIKGNVLVANPTTADSDPDDDSLTVTESTLSLVAADGSFSFDPAGDYDSLNVGDETVYEIDYTVSDGNGGTASSTASITITGVNDAPVFDVFERQTIEEGELLELTLTATDVDNDELFFDFGPDIPYWAYLDVDGLFNWLAWDVKEDSGLTYNFVVFDGEEGTGLSDSLALDIFVLDTDEPCEFVVDGAEAGIDIRPIECDPCLEFEGAPIDGIAPIECDPCFFAPEFCET